MQKRPLHTDETVSALFSLALLIFRAGLGKEKDDVINPLGIKGLGEIGIIGVAGALANAVFHATGKRVRQLPITLDKVLGLEKEVELIF